MAAASMRLYTFPKVKDSWKSAAEHFAMREFSPRSFIFIAVSHMMQIETMPEFGDKVRIPGLRKCP